MTNLQSGTIARWWLGASAVFLIALGIGFLFIPVRGGAILDLVLPTAMARTDARATYGGLNAGIGGFLLLCAARPRWLHPGLMLLAFVAGGYGTGRAIGMLVEGSANSLMLLFLGLEGFVTMVTIYLVRRLP